MQIIVTGNYSTTIKMTVLNNKSEEIISDTHILITEFILSACEEQKYLQQKH